MKNINVIGAGLAGCECAYMLAKNGYSVKLYDMKPSKKSEAHISSNFGELVCSNSLKSNSITNACGLLKEEMRIFGSLMMEAAENSKVEAGQALAVDRELFSKYITDKITSFKNIEVIEEEITNIDRFLTYNEDIAVISTGPLTSSKFAESIAKYLGEESLYFYDAEAPIVEADSIDMNIAYFMDRYGTCGEGDYLNLPMNRDEYLAFYTQLITAEVSNRHSFEKLILFEGCKPIEEMARTGENTLTFGTLKPVGLDNKKDQKNYAVVQLRPENKEKTAYNLVGFQTSLKFKEQDRVFKMIPGLKNATFLRYGVMHRNTYINGGKFLNCDFSLKKNKNIYFAGQISGVEGYVESAASGLIVALNIIAKCNKKSLEIPNSSMLGALSKYVSTENVDFQPMNANFGIICPLDEKVKDKKLKYELYSTRSLEIVKRIREEMSFLK